MLGREEWKRDLVEIAPGCCTLQIKFTMRRAAMRCDLLHWLAVKLKSTISMASQPTENTI